MIVVCIPAYKLQLEWFEEISLTQALKIFGKYDIFFCVPESIGYIYKKRYGNVAQIQCFSDEYFSSLISYSELCLSLDFYKRFENYDYMLLYQLDAFVFSDKLNYFCDMDYDYIGADTCGGCDWNLINEYVGNGGLSLRKVSSFIRVLSQYSDLLKEYPLKRLFNSVEDVFWGFCGHNQDIDFIIPSIEISNEFAVIFGAKFLVDNSDLSTVPLGTHAWHRYDYDFWKPIIEDFGYSLPECKDVKYSRTDEAYINENRYRNMVLEIRNRGITMDEMSSCSVWGAGYNGIRCVRLLNQMDVQINHVYDWNSDALAGVLDVDTPPIENPTIRNLKKMSDEEILIITTKPDSEINGKIKFMKYMMLDEFMKFVEDSVMEHTSEKNK